MHLSCVASVAYKTVVNKTHVIVIPYASVYTTVASNACIKLAVISSSVLVGQCHPVLLSIEYVLMLSMIVATLTPLLVVIFCITLNPNGVVIISLLPIPPAQARRNLCTRSTDTNTSRATVLNCSAG